MKSFCPIALYTLVLVVAANTLSVSGKTYELPDLPYAYDALEPDIDEETMKAHHDHHHAGYVRKLNAALETLPQIEADLPLTTILELLPVLGIPQSTRNSIRHNGGGHINHELYWKVMAPTGVETNTSAKLASAIDTWLGGMDDFKEGFLAAGGSVFGSGWAWLCVQPPWGNLIITTTANQDNPIMPESIVDVNCVPILGVDVWEHAYYLKRKWARSDYLEAFWNHINWEEVSYNYGNVTYRRTEDEDEDT